MYVQSVVFFDNITRFILNTVSFLSDDILLHNLRKKSLIRTQVLRMSYICNAYILLQSDTIKINMHFIDPELPMLTSNIQKNAGAFFYVSKVNISYSTSFLAYMHSGNEFSFTITLNEYFTKVGRRYMYDISNRQTKLRGRTFDITCQFKKYCIFEIHVLNPTNNTISKYSSIQCFQQYNHSETIA